MAFPLERPKASRLNSLFEWKHATDRGAGKMSNVSPHQTKLTDFGKENFIEAALSLQPTPLKRTQLLLI